MGWRRNRYNKRSSAKYKWEPHWFKATNFDEYLVEQIKAFQRSHNLDADGYCGPMTHRRIFTEREAQKVLEPEEIKSYIVCNGKKVKIDWDKTKQDFIKDGCFKAYKKEREPTMVVTHWDACTSATSCKRVLQIRGISTHFVIDNDGTIVQLVDCNNAAWHAGIRRVNNTSIGVDLSNAVYEKYNKTYVKRGFGERPIIKDWRVHGVKVKPFLGFYPIQIEAYKALIRALHDHYGIPLSCPTNKDGTLDTGVVSSARRAKFKGVVNHYNLTRGKWDTSGLELDKIISELDTN
jgi:hypothetical protein